MKPEPNLFDPVVGPICWCVPNSASCCATCREKRAEAEQKPPVIFVDTGKRGAIEFLCGDNAMTDLMREAYAQREKMIRDLYRAPNFDLGPGNIFTDFGDGPESVIMRRTVDGVNDYINWYANHPPTEEELLRRVPAGWLECLGGIPADAPITATEVLARQEEYSHYMRATKGTCSHCRNEGVLRHSFGGIGIECGYCGVWQ